MANYITIPVGPIFQGGTCRGIIHVIERGDTLYNLGQRYHVSVSALMYANPYVNVYNLQIGDELCIPVRPPQPRNVENTETASVRMPEEQTEQRSDMRMPEEEMRQEMPMRMPEEQMRQEMPMRMPEEQMRQEMPVRMPEEQMRQEMPVRMPEEQMEGRMPIWMPEEQADRTGQDWKG